jgi:hypothetical protein
MYTVCKGGLRQKNTCRKVPLQVSFLDYYILLWCLQGGSDISGTLLKLHHCVKKSYFLLFPLGQPSQMFAESWKKRTRYITAKMNLQEATRAGTVSGLRAGFTVKEIMSYGDFSKNTFCDEK